MKIKNTKSPFFKTLPPHFFKMSDAVTLLDLNDSDPIERNSILVGQGLDAASVLQKFNTLPVKNLVQSNPDYYLEDLELTAQLVQNPKLYFEKQAHSLIKGNHRFYERSFSGAAEKISIKEECLNFISEQSSKNVSESLDAIFEELFMNAVYDAVREATAYHPGMHPYLSGEKAKITLVESDNRLALSVSDPYGSLKIKKFLNRLSEVYKHGPGQIINMDRNEGAGIGCSIIFEHCSSLYLGVIPQKMTVVSCLIPTGLNYRQRAKIEKSLHLFEI